MSLPVISVAQMREWEKASWAAGKSESEVIKNAGAAVARRILELTQPGETILLLAGKGHNGDDSRAAQPHIVDRDIHLLNVVDPREGIVRFSEIIKEHPRVWIVDALFGIGLNRPLNDDWRKLIENVNKSGCPILSVDVPSGLNAESGEAEGVAIEATITLTMGAPKHGLFKATRFVGRLEVAPEIGLLPCPFTNDLNWTLTEDFAALPPRRAVESNKGSYGHVAIFAGSRGYHGAAVLAARGALRAQPGLVTVTTQEPVYLPVAAQLQSAMVRSWETSQPLPKMRGAILFGPGLAAEDLPESLKNEMRSLWRSSPMPMVVDASALDWLVQGETPSDAVRVITPHPGEAARLLGVAVDRVQCDRVLALRELSRRFGNCWVVLKGHQTLVANSSGKIFINSSGNPFLAQGGSGDLLGGYLAGLMAQPAWQTVPLTTIRYAVWKHGSAADTLSDLRKNWTIEDLAGQIGS